MIGAVCALLALPAALAAALPLLFAGYGPIGPCGVPEAWSGSVALYLGAIAAAPLGAALVLSARSRLGRVADVFGVIAVVIVAAAAALLVLSLPLLQRYVIAGCG